MRNVRLYDGTVRCGDCFDASSYQSMTDEPCTYCGSVPAPVQVFEVIMSHAEQPEDGVLCHVRASSPNAAQSECAEAVDDPDGLFYGYDFTIWPVPV